MNHSHLRLVNSAPVERSMTPQRGHLVPERVATVEEDSHIRLMGPPPVPRSMTPQRGHLVPERLVMTEEEELEDMLADPAERIAREIDRLVSRGGPLTPDHAVRMVRKLAQVVHEQHSRRRFINGSAIVYWLGAVLFMAITGKAPLAPRRGLDQPSLPPRPSSMSPYAVDASIDMLVGRCMASRREDRYASIRELCTALAALPVAAEEAPESRDSEERDSVPPSSGFVRRHRPETPYQPARMQRYRSA